MQQSSVQPVCPVCRRVENGKLIVSAIKDCPAGLVCAACNAIFPVVDDTPIILQDVDGWLNQELITVVARQDIPEATFRRLISQESPLRRDYLRIQSYENSPTSPFHEWRDRIVSQLEGSILDMGCGMAQHVRDDILGLDLDWTMLQKFNGQKMIADILNPPFIAEQFHNILLLNILDSCRQPFLLLQQANALLRPGGKLIISCPFSYFDHVTLPENQISEQFLLQSLTQLGYSLNCENHNWSLRSGIRTEVIHSCLCIEAVKLNCD